MDAIDIGLYRKVQHTAAALDRLYPGWADAVHEPIDILSPRQCVAGQVLGDFWTADLRPLGYVPPQRSVVLPNTLIDMYRRVVWANGCGLGAKLSWRRKIFLSRVHALNVYWDQQVAIRKDTQQLRAA
jgi:hypothetical protein